MITSLELGWLAGLLEGEGTFRMSTSGSPTLRIGMTDLDVIEKFRALTKTTNMKLMAGPAKPGWKPAYYTAIYGNLAIQWMMTIYPLMGVRRKEKIKEIIEKWKTVGYVTKLARIQVEKSNERSAVKSIAISRKISMEEAEKIYNNVMGKTIQ